MNLMHRRPLTADLRAVDLFRECSTRELRQIARLSTGIEVPAARALCVEGALGAEFFVIARGSAWVERRGRRIAFLKPGQAFGEIALLSRSGRCQRTATVVAAEPMHVLVFSRAEFNTSPVNPLPPAHCATRPNRSNWAPAVELRFSHSGLLGSSGNLAGFNPA